jgi:hypothetical protein
MRDVMLLVGEMVNYQKVNHYCDEGTLTEGETHCS